MIGGVGPESTIDYYKNIIAMYRERQRDGSYPQFVINSIDLKKGIDFMKADNLTAMADYLLEEILKLPRAGAEFGLIAANTPHIVFDDIAPKSPIPLISIVEATCAHAKARKLKRLALFGTRYTMQADFYGKCSRAKEWIWLCRSQKTRITSTRNISPSSCPEYFCPRRAPACSPLSIA